MKRVIRYSSFVLALGIMFSACYYMSYRSALGKLRRMESRQDMDALFDEQMKLAERMFRNLTGRMEEEKKEEGNIPVQGQATPTPDPLGEEADAVAAGQIAPERVLTTTKIIAETYDSVTGKFSTRETMPDSAMIGMTREELSDYLAQELVNMPDSERDQGLILNELITFSRDRIIVRKTYDSNRIDFLYYVAVKNGEVVVYHNDRITVYEYTGISALSLAEEERLALLSGIRVKTQEELFSLLESYSS
ncbi:MAG: hypothetical protein K2N63_09225 [Lachnospiraceae bacterium]|nr:hypothetical protein [Lachnospiraceae bacterium]